MTDFSNAYEDARMAEAYSRLEFPNTYYLAFRDLPAIYKRHVYGSRGLDFGCGAGRSSRFLKKLGFDVIGADISDDMLKLARSIDPQGDYRQIAETEFSVFADRSFDLVQSAFTFDNIPKEDQKLGIMKEIRRVLADTGRFVNLVSSPEIYYYEWASFTTRDFPENRNAKCGEIVKIINLDVADSRPVDDVIFPDADYRRVYEQAGFEVVEMVKPLGKPDEPYKWVNETRIAPWTIYVLAPGAY